MTFSVIKSSKFLSVSFYFSAIYFLTLGACYALPNYVSDKNLSNKSVSDKNVSKNKLNPTMTAEINSLTQLSDFEKVVATKMALDLRYFCPESESTTLESTSSKKNEQCLQPVIKLPQALADMVTVSGIGSVVLFAENLESTKQIIQLTHDLQRAAVQSKTGQPLIISIDQEGGRVVRLPHATSFAGNMAIGATYLDHGVKFATQTSTVIAKELAALGFNNNYAPVVDVNTNAANPVINTRSFGEKQKCT